MGSELYFATTKETDIMATPIKFEVKDPMSKPKISHSLVKAEDIIYCIGGFNNEYLADVEYYVNGKWTSTSPLPENVGSPAATYMKDIQRLYVFGGKKTNGYSDGIQYFQLENGLPNAYWELLEIELDTKIFGYSIAVPYHDSILILGGVKQNNICFVFDVKSNELREKEDLVLPANPERFKRNSGVGINGRAYMLTQKTLDLYCLIEEKWNVISSSDWSGDKIVFDI